MRVKIMKMRLKKVFQHKIKFKVAYISLELLYNVLETTNSVESSVRRALERLQLNYLSEQSAVSNNDNM